MFVSDIFFRKQLNLPSAFNVPLGRVALFALTYVCWGSPFAKRDSHRQNRFLASLD
jgi:hypothetical protein